MNVQYFSIHFHAKKEPLYSVTIEAQAQFPRDMLINFTEYLTDNERATLNGVLESVTDRIRLLLLSQLTENIE